MLPHTNNSKFSSHYPVPELGTYQEWVLWEEEGKRQQRTDDDSLDMSYLSWKPKRNKAKQKDPRPLNTLLPRWEEASLSNF